MFASGKMPSFGVLDHGGSSILKICMFQQYIFILECIIKLRVQIKIIASGTYHIYITV